MQQQHHYTQYSFLLQHLTSHSNTKVTTKRKRLFRSVNSENFVDLPSLVFIIVVVVIAIAKAKAKQCDFYLLKVFAIAFSTNSTKKTSWSPSAPLFAGLFSTNYLLGWGWLDGWLLDLSVCRLVALFGFVENKKCFHWNAFSDWISSSKNRN